MFPKYKYGRILYCFAFVIRVFKGTNEEMRKHISSVPVRLFLFVVHYFAVTFLFLLYLVLERTELYQTTLGYSQFSCHSITHRSPTELSLPGCLYLRSQSVTKAAKRRQARERLRSLDWGVNSLLLDSKIERAEVVASVTSQQSKGPKRLS